MDKPNERSSHKDATLLGGGIVFYIAVLIYFLIFGFHYPWFFTGLTLITAISYADDIKPQSARRRLVVHLAAMMLMIYQLGLFSYPWFILIVALVLAVGIINAYNFMDGINGITGAYNVVFFGTLWYINQYVEPFTDVRLIYLVLLSLLVFNFFNFRKKAKCFAGDVGAVSIAFTAVFLLGLLILKSGDFSYILLLVIFGVDVILTIIHRLILKENVFEAHRKHMYQLMANELKMPHLLVASLYAVTQLCVNIGLLLFMKHKLVYFLAVIILFATIYYLFKKKYFYLHQQKQKN